MRREIIWLHPSIIDLTDYSRLPDGLVFMFAYLVSQGPQRLYSHCARNASKYPT